MSFRTTKELSTKECELLLENNCINSKQLEQLLDAREKNHISFNLVDVREKIEWYQARIKNTNYLIPTTSFYEELKQIENQKDVTTIVYCHIGQRSSYCQKIMKKLGFKSVVDLSNGIADYSGKLEHGE